MPRGTARRYAIEDVLRKRLENGVVTEVPPGPHVALVEEERAFATVVVGIVGKVLRHLREVGPFPHHHRRSLRASLDHEPVWASMSAVKDDLLRVVAIAPLRRSQAIARLPLVKEDDVADRWDTIASNWNRQLQITIRHLHPALCHTAEPDLRGIVRVELPSLFRAQATRGDEPVTNAIIDENHGTDLHYVCHGILLKNCGAIAVAGC